MAVFGRPQSFVLVEDEEGSPWEPYHVERGFDRVASTVTAMSWMGAIGPESESIGDKAGPHLKAIGLELAHGMHPMALRFGHHLMVTVLIPPPIAKVIAAEGYSKREAVEEIFKHSSMTVHHINERLLAVPDSLRRIIEVERGIPLSSELEQDKQFPATVSPDLIHIVVCGSRERNRTLMFFSFYTRPVTREVKLPANWDKLLKKA